jgi:hypothetical protein
MSEETYDGMKLLLTYSIRPESAQEYYEFVLGSYVPTMQALGLEMSEAWHTAYGPYPDRLVGFVSHDRETMLALIENNSWLELNEQLLEYVFDFEYKILKYGTGFQF